MPCTHAGQGKLRNLSIRLSGIIAALDPLPILLLELSLMRRSAASLCNLYGIARLL
jgi:hypothetical protein